MAGIVGHSALTSFRPKVGVKPSVQAGGVAQAAAPIAPDLAAYRKAVANLQGQVDADVARLSKPGPDGLGLAPGMQSFLMVQPTPNAKGTVVLFHGYTAGPWQYPDMAERFYKAGYNVYVPRMPGHGYTTTGGKPTPEKLPTTEAQYETWIDQTYRDVAALGAPVSVAGLSGGGNIALRMAEKYPSIKSCVAFSPYFGASGIKGSIFSFFNGADALTKGWAGRELDHIPTGKNYPETKTPHTKGSLGQALAMNEVGRRVQKVPCPLQIVNTEGDFLSGATHSKALLAR